VLKRDKKCVICGNKKQLSVDHKDRDRKNNTLSNLQTLCLPCHGRKDGKARKKTSGWKWGDRNGKVYGGKV